MVSYPTEELIADVDDGTMPNNVAQLEKLVVGHRIISAEKGTHENRWGNETDALIITLDNGMRVVLQDTDDCCAYTSLRDFFLDPNSVDHMIMGVGTTDKYTTWHIYADFGDIMRLQVGWSCGNPFYYGYGFSIAVEDVRE
jgi:hypothetical protein